LEFEEYVELLEDTLCPLGNVQTKAINYGVQIILTGAGRKVTLNVYNGKKGIRLVWGGGDSDLLVKAREQVHKITIQNGDPETDPVQSERGKMQERGGNQDSVRPVVPRTRILLTDEPGFPGIWMGSDESGKGDYFGPLAVAAVCLDRSRGEKLLAAGARDCKSLSDAKILALAEEIKTEALAFSVLVMKPLVYNMRYSQIQEKGGTLNDLLALGHIAALKQTWHKIPYCKWAVVDQFAANDKIPEGVHEFAPDLKVMQRPRAEEDIAVAAASILARAAFLKAIQDLGETAGIGKIPKGGGEAATNAARRLMQKQGNDLLCHYVKLHFANSQKL